jgi:hypothetical protein
MLPCATDDPRFDQPVIFLQANWIVGFVFAYVYFMGGKFEAKHGRRNHGPYWALASIIVTAVVIQGLHGGAFLVIVGQVLLFIAITLWRMKFEK